MKVKTEDFVNPCGHRSVDECSQALCGFGAEKEALEALVDKFAEAMKQRLGEKYMKGWHGWDDETNYTFEQMDAQIQKNLNDAARRPAHQDMGRTERDMVDIANLAAFWWNRFGNEKQ